MLVRVLVLNNPGSFACWTISQSRIPHMTGHVPEPFKAEQRCLPHAVDVQPNTLNLEKTCTNHTVTQPSVPCQGQCPPEVCTNTVPPCPQIGGPYVLSCNPTDPPCTLRWVVGGGGFGTQGDQGPQGPEGAGGIVDATVVAVLTTGPFPYAKLRSRSDGAGTQRYARVLTEQVHAPG